MQLMKSLQLIGSFLGKAKPKSDGKADCDNESNPDRASVDYSKVSIDFVFLD